LLLLLLIHLFCLLRGLLGLLNQARQRVLVAIVGLRLRSSAIMLTLALLVASG
jgi:hypothetical protein